MEFRVHLFWLRLQSRELGLLLGIGHKILKKLCGGWVRSHVTRLCFLFLCTSQWCECVEEPDDDTKIIYYLAGSVEIWRFLNVLIIMKLIGGYFFRQQQHFTSWEFLNLNVSILTKCALKLVLEYSEHTMCPNYQLGPDSSRNIWQSDICPMCCHLARCSTAAGRGMELIRGNLAGQQYQLAVTLTRDKTNS